MVNRDGATSKTRERRRKVTPLWALLVTSKVGSASFVLFLLIGSIHLLELRIKNVSFEMAQASRTGHKELLRMKTAEEPKRTWRVVEIRVEREQAELASWLFMHMGANGVEEQASDGGATTFHATFEESALPDGDLTAVYAALDEYGLAKSLGSLKVSQIMEEDWLAKWKEGFEPFPVGEKLVVCPAWLADSLSAEQISGRKVILIEPGLAFGTGFHATTRFCLLALERYVYDAQLIFDIGTGSGILAVGAALLNPSVRIIAVETDPLACRVARENFELNNVADRIELLEGSTELLKPRFNRDADLILSNLTYEDNSALLADYVALAKTKAHAVFAGIISGKFDLMRKALAEHGITIADEEIGEMWLGIVGTMPV